MNIMSEQTLPVTSHFSTNAFAMARLAGDRVEYDLEKLDHFRDTAQGLVGRTIPEIGNLALVFRYAPRGGEIPADPSFTRSTPNDSLWVPESELALPKTQRPLMESRAEVEQGSRKSFEVNLKDFESPIIMSVVDSLCYPPPEDQVMRPGGGRFLKAWIGQVVETFTGPSEDKIRQLKEQSAKYFSGAIALRSRARFESEE